MSNDDDIHPGLRVMKAKFRADKNGPTVSGEDRCGFCGKRRAEVESLVAGPAVFICDECVAACNEILKHD